jgi:hypothetical protein
LAGRAASAAGCSRLLSRRKGLTGEWEEEEEEEEKEEEEKEEKGGGGGVYKSDQGGGGGVKEARSSARGGDFGRSVRLLGLFKINKAATVRR